MEELALLHPAAQVAVPLAIATVLSTFFYLVLKER